MGRAGIIVDPVVGGYGTAKPFSLRAIVLTAAAHVAVLPLALSLGQQAMAGPEERVATFDLAAPPAPPPAPPPPPPASEPPPPDTAPTDPLPEAVVPPTMLALSEPQPAAAVVPLSAPAQVATPAKVTPPAPAAPARASLAAAPSTISSDALDTSLISGAPPRYPRESRRKREQGTVELLVIVGTDGRVETISVARSSGSPRLDDAALGAVRGWRWQPASRKGEAVKVRGIVAIPFVLTSDRKSPHRADCHSADSHCHADGRSRRADHHGRMDRRDGDIGHAGPDGER